MDPLGDLALVGGAARLLVERVEELLAGGRAREVGALVERPAEEAEVVPALGGPVERHAHAVEEVDDLRCPVGHLVHGGLLGQEVPAVDGLLEVLPLAEALLARDVVARVDAALRAHRVAALHGDDAEEVDLHPELGALDCAREAREPASDDDDALVLGGHGWLVACVVRSCQA